MNYEPFLRANSYVDFTSPLVERQAAILFQDRGNAVEKARTAYEFVRDEIPHSFDIGAKVITASASEVLRHRTGICHAKSNLLAALLRSQGIPCGFCYQRLTRASDDSRGYCLHCFNAARLNDQWIFLDARGNTNGRNAQFSLAEPILAFVNRPQYDEYIFDGIFADPDEPSMNLLVRATTLAEVLENLPEKVFRAPEIPGKPFMNILVRSETPSDEILIDELTRRAFLSHPFSRHTEQFIIRALRKAHALSASLVADNAGCVVGHVALSPVTLDDKTTGWYGLGPISVDPEYQRRGIGRILMESAIAELRKMGANGCVLVGEPAFYSHFGFTRNPAVVLEGVPQEFFMTLTLGKSVPSGCVQFHSAFLAEN